MPVTLDDLRERLHLDLRIPWFDVTDRRFGAKGNGVADDSTAFRAAKTAAGVGGYVNVPAGTYVVENIVLDVASQHWYFAPGAILKLKDGSTQDGLLRGQADFLTIRGGEFDGNRANVSSSAFGGAITVRGSGCKIAGVYVHDTKGYGILGAPLGAGTAMNDVEISGSRFRDTENGPVFFDYSSATVSSNSVRIVSCWADNTAVAAATILGAGFAVKGPATLAFQPRGCVISGCYVKSRTDPVTATSGVGFNRCNTGQCVGNYVEGTSIAYTFPTSVGIGVSGCTSFGAKTTGFEFVGSGSITACTVDGNGVTSGGITFNSVTDASAAGCVVKGLDPADAGASCISVINSTTVPKRIALIGNTLFSCRRGISVIGGVEDLLISANFIAGDTTNAVSRLGIEIETVAGARRWVISANAILDFNSAGIRFFAGSGQTLSNVRLLGNTFFNCSVPPVGYSNVTLDATCVVENDGGDRVMGEGGNIILGTATGTKIGTATSQKLGFYNATPVVQPAANPDTSGAALGALETEVNELKALLRSLGLMG